MRNVYKMLIGKLEGERSLGKMRHRQEDNIKLIQGEEGGCGLGLPGSE
jgi:hypothetical protein